jgi:predicted kinase
MQAVILMGVQGAGKTTFYDQRFRGTHTHISRDVLGSFARERAAIADCISTRTAFVVDNTNARAAARAPYITLARAGGFRVIGYFFETEMRAAIARNNKRTNRKPVPVPALIRTWKQLEPPTPAEGFDELYTAVPKRDLTFDVAPRATL